MTRPDPARTVALVGNPRAGSRTLGAAVSLAATLAERLGGGGPTAVDLASLARGLHAQPRPADLDAALAAVAAADLLVVATPVHKASFTGLLKSFLDLYGPDGLDGVTAVPLVVSATPAHTLVGEVHLRPVLVELGASVPTRTLSVLDTDLADLAPAVERWWQRAERPLRRAVTLPAASTRSEDLLEVAR
ncbi:NADPH-dependent FMN reductase [Cellulomonas flavigena DSM 20109]|uniref:NADPH-dependent FMN reductase n=1 Tax=Cellulomonas flavigena (strain ATCC 482 / DSM 20109 / BCRC 11376 / JCM 18109 / NBRC 3775 / NCIMB 8073 / NRS 134) TaxID=446466 RepID=D5UKE0_CELFN|nr:NAD(P)H-dependent oxidoreductase [Cellulomonas flavigena]ADG75801.1 NADPH-dependent FMN reductase [Cellulomonas flavigena DSM 20109]